MPVKPVKLSHQEQVAELDRKLESLGGLLASLMGGMGNLHERLEALEQGEQPAKPLIITPGMMN